MKLYDLLKDKIPDAKGVISDNEMCVINRRDFLYGETSFAAAFLKMYGYEKSSYEMYSMIDFIYASVCKVRLPTEIKIFQLSQSMTLPSLAISSIVADQASSIKIFAPRGIEKFAPKDSFAKELAERFRIQLNSGLQMSDVGTNESIDILLCNASNEAEVSSALKAFERVKRGFIIIKGYGRKDAPNCGEIILSARLNIHCSVAGFGYCMAV